VYANVEVDLPVGSREIGGCGVDRGVHVKLSHPVFDRLDKVQNPIVSIGAWLPQLLSVWM